MLGPVHPTPYDWRFYVFGIFTRVHPFFWLMCFIMGWPRQGDGWAEAIGTNDFMIALLWAICVFVSILVHELGHALTARHFGWQPEIVLYHFGGLASFTPTWGYTTKRSVLISLNGPFAGFVLYGIVVAIKSQVPIAVLVQYPALDKTFLNMEFINLWWGLINLLPVYPLDGGQVCRDLLIHLKPRDGHQLAMKISMVTGGVVAFYALQSRQLYIGILFAMLAFNCFQQLQQHRRGPW